MSALRIVSRALPALAFAWIVLQTPSAAAGPARPGEPAGALKPPFDQVGFDQRLGERVPLDLAFVDEAGLSVTLGDYAVDKPLVLSLAYYRCPMLCPLVQNGIAGSLKVVGLRPGTDFNVLTVSIDPGETPAMAAASRATSLERLGVEGSERGWHFLTGHREAIDRLAQAVGFRYVYDAQTGQYAHGGGIVVLTPDGRVAQYFFGIDFAPRDLRLALVEASGGRIGTVIDKLVLLCYQYDPAAGGYGLLTYRLVRAGGVLTVALLAGFVFLMLRRESARSAGRTA
ncbi:MAG TPA: SCO family protein [Candidatus Polarisedimenticolia bacterium]|nr:SCO family protein [Candidatus Polarisedimenticolia bacterium]